MARVDVRTLGLGASNRLELAAALVTAARERFPGTGKSPIPTPPSLRVESFYRHALPGMTLSPKADGAMRYREFYRQKPEPQCKCGKPISRNKRFCQGCLNEAIHKMMLGEADQETVMFVAESTTREQRAEIIEALQKLRESEGLHRIDTSVEVRGE